MVDGTLFTVKNKRLVDLERFQKDIAAQIEVERIATERWRQRAQRVLGAYKQLEQENERLRQDNVRLAEKIVEIGTRPPTVLRPDPVDVSAILEGVKRIVAPDVVVSARPDAPDEQRMGIVWQHQGLDNNGGVGENDTKDIDDLFGPGAATTPDYVLDIERLTEQQTKGTRGGWYNPTTNSPLHNDK